MVNEQPVFASLRLYYIMEDKESVFFIRNS